MAVYFFHLRNSVDVLLDPDGREVDGEGVAAVALAEARAIVAADARTGSIDLNQKIEVEDADGEVVHRIEFEDAVQVLHRPEAVHSRLSVRD